MGRTLIDNQRDTLQCLVNLNICILMISIVVVSLGCSKLGSNQGLVQSKFPFSNRTAQSAIESPLQRASRSRQIRSEQQAKRVPENPVREEVRDVQSVTARPPKLSALPKTTLFAEPLATEASQVSFEQEVTPNDGASAKPTQSAFDPTAEPPAQIFAQPVQPASIDQGPATRVADSRLLAPMLFNPKTRKINSAFAGSLRDDKTPARVSPPVAKTSNPVQARKMFEPLIVVDETRDIPAPTRIAEVSPFPVDPEMLPLESTPNEAPIVVSEAFATLDDTPPPSPISTAQNTKTPIVDSTLGDRSENLLPPTTPVVIESEIDMAENKDDNSAGHSIQVDADLAVDFDAFPPPPTSPAEPKTEIDEPVDEPMVINVASLPPPLPVTPVMPVIDPPAEDILVRSIPEVKSHQVAESDFEPLPEQAKRCLTCEHDDCLGCQLPETAVFAEHVPNFDPGRSIVPMPVDIASLDSTELIKKNFASATFSPTDLPLPHDVDTSLDTSEDQFLAATFKETVDQEQTTPTDVPPVGVEALMKLNAVTWQSRLAQTVDLVQEQLNQQNIDSDTRTSLEVNLRLLDVLSRQMGDLVENQQQFSSSENQYWTDQLEAITSMLKVADPVDGRANELLRHHTAHETLTHLRNAVAHLESLANLRVVAGEFCTEVSGYGQFNPFAHNVFPVGQKVLVYCEVENFNSTEQDSETGGTFLTRLRGSYAIYNSSGHAVQQAEFPTLEDVARKRRRDFYMHLPITIGNLDAGNYELHLLIEDLGGNKTASLTPPLLFTVEDQQDQPVARQARR